MNIKDMIKELGTLVDVTYIHNDYKTYHETKKILLVATHDMASGGATLVLLSFLKSIKDEYEILIISPCDGEMVKKYYDAGFNIFIGNTEVFNSDKFIHILKNIDLYICNTVLCGYFVNFAKNLDVPTLWWIHEEKAFFLHYRLYLHPEKYVSNNILPVAVTRKAAEEFQEVFGIDCGVMEFGIEDEKERYTRKELAKDGNGKIKFFMPANFFWIKGQDILADAINNLPTEYMEKAEFIFAGRKDDGDTKSYDAVSMLTQKHNNIKYLGALSRVEVLKTMASSDCIISASRVDSLGATIVEGMMMERICLVSNVAGITSYMEDGVDGYIFQSESHEDLTQKIKYIIDNGNIQEEIAHNGRNVFLQYFTIVRCIEKFKLLLDTLEKRIESKRKNSDSALINRVDANTNNYKKIKQGSVSLNYSKLKVKYFDSTEIKKDDILWGLIELGINVESPDFSVELQEYNSDDVEKIEQYLENTDCAISQNFSAILAEACHRKGVRYISWVYDSPQRSLYMKEATYDTNYIFVFDKIQKQRLEEIGVRNLFYCPLAANISKASRVKITEDDDKKYGTEISFVGNLYDRDYLDAIVSEMPQDKLELLVKYLETYCYKWDGESIFDKTPVALSNFFDKFINNKDLDLYNIDRSFLIDVLLLVPMMAREERVEVLRVLSQEHQVMLYTKNYNASYDMGNTKVGPFVDSNTDMYKVFHASKLNLNITMRGIESGVPQRVFDIMSVGGVCMSNYQTEAAELFVPDKEIILFHSLEEMQDKANYYLAHESERKEIGQNAFRRVKTDYTYTILLKKILNIVFG